MSLRKDTPCDMDGICPYEAEYGCDCEYWCGAEEPEDNVDKEMEGCDMMDYVTDDEMLKEMEEEGYATREEMKKEAVQRMRKLKIIGDAIRQFQKEDIVMVSEPPFGGLYWYHDEEENFRRMKEFEKEHGALVYMVVRAWTNFGKMDSYLYVSKYKEEWEMDNEDIDDNIVMTYTVNYDMPDCSEFGSIGVRKVAGGLLRTA